MEQKTGKTDHAVVREVSGYCCDVGMAVSASAAVTLLKPGPTNVQLVLVLVFGALHCFALAFSAVYMKWNIYGISSL